MIGVESSAIAAGQVVDGGFQVYADYDQAKSANATVNVDNFQSAGVDNGVLLKLHGPEVLARQLTINGEARVYPNNQRNVEAGRAGQPIMETNLVCDLINEETGAAEGTVRVPANLFDKMVTEYSVNPETAVATRKRTVRGNGTVNMLYRRYTKKGQSVAKVLEEQTNHKGFRVNCITVPGIAFSETGNGATVENAVPQDQTTYEVNWVD